MRQTEGMGWPEAIFFLGGMIAILFLIGIATSALMEVRKSKLLGQKEDQLRQLVQRYEQLAAGTLDAQQRTAADLAELRARTAAVEQILRTVE